MYPFDSLQTVLSVRNIPSNMNVIADVLTRFIVPVNTKWKLYSVVNKVISLHCGGPLVVLLFVAILNQQLETYNISLKFQARKVGRWM